MPRGVFPPSASFCCPAGIVVIKFIRFLYRSPWAIQKRIYLRIFRPLLEKLNRETSYTSITGLKRADVLARIAEQRGFRLVLHMHNSLLHPRSRKHFPALKHVPIVFCSEFLRNEATSAYPNHFQRTHVVYNGADRDKFRAGRRRQKPVPQIIFTGRLVPYKGAHVLTGAMEYPRNARASQRRARLSADPGLATAGERAISARWSGRGPAIPNS